MTAHPLDLDRTPLRPHRWLGVAPALAAAPHLAPARLGWNTGGIARFRVLGRRFAAITDPGLARQILQGDQFRRSYHYATYRIILGNGLFSSDGPDWARRRRMLLPAFRSDAVAAQAPRLEACVQTLLQRWHRQAATGTPVDAVAESHRLTLDVIGRTLLSTVLSPAEADTLAEILAECLVLVRRRNTALLRLPLWLPVTDHRRLRRIRQRLDAFITPFVDARLARPNPGRQDLLDDLIAARHPSDGQGLTRTMLIEETKTLFITGYETTGVTLSWILYLLATHPEQSERWHQACDRIAAGTPADSEAATAYLSAIINEGMRLFPAAYNLARVCTTDSRCGEIPFRTGETALISVFGIHRDTAVWGDADRFRPDRFLDPGCPLNSFLPFASGKHLCIGAGFAQMEMLTILRAIGQAFTLRPLTDTPVGMVARVTLAPDRAIPLQVIPR